MTLVDAGYPLFSPDGPLIEPPFVAPHERLGVAGEMLAEGAPPVDQRRGIGWVLRSFAAGAVLLVSVALVADFLYRLSAERALARAARAAVLEATLPRATRQSVEQTAHRRLADRAAAQASLGFALRHNGLPTSGPLRPRGGDRLSVALTMPTSAALPAWFQPLAAWHSDGAELRVVAERRMPGPSLAESEAGLTRRGGLGG